MKKSKNLLAWLYIIAVFFVVPLYNEGTFYNITQRKVVAYQMICGLALVFYFVLSLVGDIRKKEGAGAEAGTGTWKILRRPTDVLMVAFVVVAAVSTLLSEYRQDAIYGVPGFGMGLLTIVLMVLSYFLISRNMICDERILYLITASSVIPTALVIINRLGFDPLGMYPEEVDAASNLYVSTFGNYGWFNQYLSVIIPISIYMIFVAQNLWVKVLYGLHLLLSMVAWCMAGTKTLLVSVVAVVCAMWMWKMFKAQGIKISPRLFASMIIPAMVAYVLGVVFGMADDGFASGRGYIWRVSGELFKSFSIKDLLVGVGPNCYTYALDDFLLGRTDLLAEFNAHFQEMALTSAHSEYFDYLINCGVVGVGVYVAMLAAFVMSFVRSEKTTVCQNAAMLCVISYAVYAAFSFSIVVATPMFFVLLGIVGCGLEKKNKVSLRHD